LPLAAEEIAGRVDETAVVLEGDAMPGIREHQDRSVR
jgi:hypothetical protein